MALKSAARWEIDLSAGGAKFPLSVLIGLKCLFNPAP
jgi:hypothetical protein